MDNLGCWCWCWYCYWVLFIFWQARYRSQSSVGISSIFQFFVFPSPNLPRSSRDRAHILSWANNPCRKCTKQFATKWQTAGIIYIYIYISIIRLDDNRDKISKSLFLSRSIEGGNCFLKYSLLVEVCLSQDSLNFILISQWGEMIDNFKYQILH